MKLVIHKPSEKQIGNVRVSEEVFNKVAQLSKFKGVSNQTIVRSILETVIDEVKV